MNHYVGPASPPPGFTHLARPEGFLVAVYDTFQKPRRTIARVRRGDVIPARRAEPETRCSDEGRPGTWWEVPNGFICSASGFTIATRLEQLEPPQRIPAVNQPSPFRYARIVVEGAPRWPRRPAASDLNACVGADRTTPRAELGHRVHVGRLLRRDRSRREGR
ncbi:MAG: hypothetical protein HC923_09970 [Myxococcales bacterium]|nr:hypothetical protein [Myxococcales bacterium]